MPASLLACEMRLRAELKVKLRRFRPDARNAYVRFSAPSPGRAGL